MSRKFRLDPNMGGLRGRIDTRPPSAEKAAGLRNIHRDMSGEVIGAQAADGTPLGIKRFGSSRQAATANDQVLAARQGLHRDMMAAGKNGVTQEMAQRAQQLGVSGQAWNRVMDTLPDTASIPAAPVASAPAPAVIAPKPAAVYTPKPLDPATAKPTIGPGIPLGTPTVPNGPPATPIAPAQLQKTASDAAYATIADQRQATNYQAANRATPFTDADVTKAQKAGFGTATPDAPQSVAKAPSNTPQVNRLTGKPFGYHPGDVLPPGLVPQIATNTPGVAAAGAGGPRINRITGRPFGAQPVATAPLSGKALAETNIAKMGVQGTIAHMQKNEALSKTKKAGDKWRMATAPTPDTKPPALSAGAGGSFRQAAGLPQPSAIAKSFEVAPAKNFQAVSATPATPVAPQPVSEFQTLTTPKPVATAAPAAMPAKPQTQAAQKTSPWRRTMVPPGGPAFTTPAAVQQRGEAKVAAAQAQKRQEYNKAWNATPNLPVADPGSVANKVYKSARTFLSGKSY